MATKLNADTILSTLDQHPVFGKYITNESPRNVVREFLDQLSDTLGDLLEQRATNDSMGSALLRAGRLIVDTNLLVRLFQAWPEEAFPPGDSPLSSEEMQRSADSFATLVVMAESKFSGSSNQVTQRLDCATYLSKEAWQSHLCGTLTVQRLIEMDLPAIVSFLGSQKAA